MSSNDSNTHTHTKTSFPSFIIPPCVKIAVLADQPTDEMVELEGEDGISDETLVSIVPSDNCPEIDLLEFIQAYVEAAANVQGETANVVRDKVLLRLNSDVAYSLQESLEESDDFGEVRYGYEMVLDLQQVMKKKKIRDDNNNNVRKRHVCGSMKTSEDSSSSSGSGSVHVGKDVVMESVIFSSSENVPDGYIATRLEEEVEEESNLDKSNDGAYVFSISAKGCSHHILRVRDSDKEDGNDNVFRRFKATVDHAST
eukprot:CAMPEP_0116067264 /NCGR_PEP_ID=MMETSP0322-20121206/10898_1 /TAXON_ID=163516 /ORGANISM="Leptocylindrus danicus var. apora, Strain B651" /LENGTH=255 /DNA_ID=CAMNT_0003554023 /DNA_START=18 /DNA_END=785 /DNA_ORIENTATION=+